MHNALEAPARGLCGDVDRLLAALARAGAVAPRLTGSGSACFAICRTASEARGIAARLAAEQSAGRPAWPGVFAVRLALPGAAACREPQMEQAWPSESRTVVV
jgi:4-diphosphocytidyl-2C-methyl-D-erythritol kinase